MDMTRQIEALWYNIMQLSMYIGWGWEWAKFYSNLYYVFFPAEQI